MLFYRNQFLISVSYKLLVFMTTIEFAKENLVIYGRLNRKIQYDKSRCTLSRKGDGFNPVWGLLLISLNKEQSSCCPIWAGLDESPGPLFDIGPRIGTTLNRGCCDSV